MQSSSSDQAPILCETALADAGELAGPLTHEVNDLLNSLSLHLAVIQLAASKELAAELQEVRRQLTHVAGVVTRFQRRRRLPLESKPIDMNLALRHALLEIRSSPEEVHATKVQEIGPQDSATIEPGTTCVRLELAQDLPPVTGHMPDARRLCRLLLCNACRSVGPGGQPVWARTTRLDDGPRVHVVVGDNGPEIASEKLPRIFDPGNEQREGMCCLELAACKSIVRRFHGTIEPITPEGGGLTITATFPAMV